MSLSCLLTRSFNRSTVSVRPFRKFYTASLANMKVSLPKLGSVDVCESHEQKNARLKRPLSPHLSIYKIQLTSGLSVTHRATGIILTAYAVALSIVGLCGGVDPIVTMIDDWCLPPGVLYLGRLAFVLPVTFHFYNGIRHLIWDTGKCLTIKQVYKTGYIVMILSVLSAIAVAAIQVKNC